MNGAECLLRTLVANGVRICFMNPGTSEMQFVSALDRVPEMRAILCLFEGVCSGAADGYARMTGRPASTLLHLGPGLANGLANFHNARKARSPIVSIVGEHTTDHLRYDAPLTANVEAFARSVSDAVKTCNSSYSLGTDAAWVVEAAAGPPGRIATLIVPADHSWSEAGEPGPAARPKIRYEPNPEPFAPLLQNGPSTGLLLSGKALSPSGLDAAARLAARHGVRVYADRNAARIPNGRGQFKPNRIAYFPEPAEKQLAGLTDLLLFEAKPAISFFGYPGRRSTLAPEACRIHQVAKLDQDGVAALTALAANCPPAPIVDPEPAQLPPDGELTAESVAQTIAALLPDAAIVSDESVSCGEPVWRWLQHAAAHDFLPVTGGSIGQGMPVAVGAAVACPGRKVVAIEADGSGMYTLQSLWTAARERLDLTVVILANRRYRILDIERQRTRAGEFGPKASEMIDIGRPELDWVSLARGMGVEAWSTKRTQDFTRCFGEAMRRPGNPCLIEAVITA